MALCRDTMRDTAEEACDTARKRACGRDDMAGGACDTVGPGLQHNQAKPTTRRSARALCMQAGPGCAHYALDSVLTQCTVLSHCLGHCS